MGIFDMFKPRWKNSNPEIRLQAIREMDLNLERAAFEEFLLLETDVSVITAGVEKLNDFSLCEKLLGLSQGELAKLLKQKLEDLSFEILQNDLSLNSDQIGAYARHLTAIRFWESLAVQAKSQVVRKHSLQKVGKEALWLLAAQQDESEQIALYALEQLSGKENFEKVSQSHKHIAVREKVRAILQVFEEEERKAQEQKRIQQQVELIRSTFKKIVAENTILDRANDIQSFSDEWAQLQQAGVVDAEITNLALTLKSKSEELLRIQAEKAKEAELEENRKAQAVALLSIINSASRASVEKLMELQNDYSALEANKIEGVDSSLFVKAQAAIQSQQNYLNQQSTQNAAVSTENANASSVSADVNLENDARPQILADLKELEKAERFGGIQVKKLKESWKELGQIAWVQDEIQKEWLETLKRVEGVLSERKSHEIEEFESKSAKLKEIITRAGQINPEGEFEEISEALRNCVQEWKDIVGEEKRRYYSLWQEFKQATAQFQEMRQWEQWHNENEKQAICEQAEALKDVQSEDELFQQLKDIREKWKNAGNISPEKHQQLWDRYKKATDEAQERLVGWLDRKKEERETNLQSKTLLCDEMERLLNDENWTEAQGQFKEIQERWKKIGAVPKEFNDSIWDRFKSISERFYSKRKEVYEAVGVEREDNLKQKEAILAQMEALKEAKDWNEATRNMRKLHDDWKAVGPVPKTNAEILWNRFREVNEAFYNQRNAFFEELERQKQENLEFKTKLCQELESFATVPFTQEILLRVEQIKVEWKESGLIPKEDSDRLWERFCLAGDVLLEKQAETDEVLKKALKERLDKKTEIISKAKELSESTDWGVTTQELKKLQDEWRNIGRVGPQDSDLWKSFRDACDDFFARRRDQFEILEQHRINNLEQKMALIDVAEKLAQEGYSESSAHEIRMLRARWKEIGHVPKKDADRIWKKFQTACDAVFKARTPSSEA